MTVLQRIFVVMFAIQVSVFIVVWALENIKTALAFASFFTIAGMLVYLLADWVSKGAT